MAANNGVLIIAPVRPPDSNDIFPTAYANEIRGGHHSYATIAERDAISAQRLQVGMFCSVQETGLVYILQDLTPTWIEFSSGSPSISGADIIGGSGIQVIESPANTFTVSVSADYALTSTLVSVSGDLQNQINNIVQESTTVSSSSGNIIVQNYSDNWDVSVADYISATEVANISGDLQSQIDAISGGGTVGPASNNQIAFFSGTDNVTGNSYFYINNGQLVVSDDLDFVPRGSGTYSIAIGDNSTSSGVSGVAIGSATLATDVGVAIGARSQAYSGVAIGFRAETFGAGGVSLGQDSKSAMEAVAIGRQASAGNSGAVAIGLGSNAPNLSAIAIGLGSSATANNTIAIGRSATNSETNTSQIGSATYPINKFKVRTSVGNRDLLDDPTRAEVAAISGNLQTQIDSISGGSSITLLEGTGIQIVESPADTFTISVSGDYASMSDLADVSGAAVLKYSSMAPLMGDQVIYSGIDIRSSLGSALKTDQAFSTVTLGENLEFSKDQGYGAIQNPDWVRVTPVDPSIAVLVNGNTNNTIYEDSTDNKLKYGNEVFAFTSDVSGYVLESTVAAISGNLQSQIDSISGSDTVLIGGVGVSVSEGPTDTWTISVSGDYALNSFVEAASANSLVHSMSYTNSQLGDYTLITTTAAISSGLQSQIDNIVSESTTISSSGNSITVVQSGNNFNLEVASAPINDHNDLTGLQGGTTNEYYHLTAAEHADYISATEVAAEISGKQSTITGGATTITSSNLTVSRALVSDGSGKVAVATTTSTELGYVAGVTSAIQTQINAILAAPTMKCIVDVTSNSGQTIANGGEPTIIYEDKNYDKDSNFNTGTGTFTAPVSGWYQFDGFITFNTFTWSTSRAYFRAYVNSAKKADNMSGYNSTSDYMIVSLSGTVFMAAADTLTFKTTQDSGTTRALLNDGTFNQMRIIGPIV